MSYPQVYLRKVLTIHTHKRILEVLPKTAITNAKGDQQMKITVLDKSCPYKLNYHKVNDLVTLQVWMSY